MTSDELRRDDRFVRAHIPLEFLMSDSITAEGVETMMKNMLENEEMREMMTAQLNQQGGAQSFGFGRRVRPTDDGADEFMQSSMHSIFMGEIQALEAAGRSAWDFVDDDELPWKFQLDMARQCWDETRHVEIYSALLDHVGGKIGQFPENVMLFEFSCADDPAERVVGVNRCLEGLALDGFNDTITFGKRAGDECIWRTVDFVAADEVTHVRFGQVWSKALTDNDPERRKRVLDFQRKVDKAFSFGGLRGAYDHRTGEQILPLAMEFRRLAGFDQGEMDQVLGSGPSSTIDPALLDEIAQKVLGG
jgi:uncharacterized ferritin-like protein (DUF455 family)